MADWEYKRAEIIKAGPITVIIEGGHKVKDDSNQPARDPDLIRDLDYIISRLTAIKQQG